MKREAVLFYKSFDEAISMLSDEDQLKAYRAIMRYGLYGEEPSVDGVAGAIFLLAKPQIDANNRRYENGKQGGRPKRTDDNEKDNSNKAKDKQENTDKKPNENLTKTNAEAKEKDKVKDKVKDKDKIKENTNNVPTRAEIELIFENLWKAYPEKKGKGRVSYADKRKLADIGEDHIFRAIARYMNEIKQTGWKQYQNGSTFFHSGYIDYLDENYEKSKHRGRPASNFNNDTPRDYNMDELEMKLLATN